jgi:hypothetical protein
MPIYLDFLKCRENIGAVPVSTQRKAPRGRPPKKTATVVKRILEVARSGLPIHFAAKAGDISIETLYNWREKDPQFARDFEAARLEAVERRWKRIEKAARGSQEHPPDWKADAWSLERVYPQLFGRPDLQLSVNQSVSTGPTNVVVLGPERAKILATRHEQIRAKSIALLDARVTNTGNGQGSAQQLPAASESASSQVPTVPTDSAPAQEPLPTKPSSWWRQFVFPGALIHKADATLAVRMILNELRIPVDESVLDFKTDQIVQSTFCEALEKLTDSDLGWRTMTQIYQRELRRADHQS